MKKTLTYSLIAAALAVASSSAMAQDWTGFYIGAYAGDTITRDDDAEIVQFDTNLDGNFNNSVNTSGGANAFSPGFCNGAANGPTPGAGCDGNDGGSDYGFRAGYDWQRDQMVYGVVLEYGNSDFRDAVTAFSTTPAYYTMLRKVDDVMAIRARVGFAFGDDDRNLIYGTGGYASANVENYFLTSNGVNTFDSNGDTDADGYQLGVGFERMFGDNFSVGLEYLHSNLDDDGAITRAQGPAPATNPFILVNAAGTDFRRTDNDLDLDSVRLTASFRF